jgi:hypothetical protein
MVKRSTKSKKSRKTSNDNGVYLEGDYPMINYVMDNINTTNTKYKKFYNEYKNILNNTNFKNNYAKELEKKLTETGIRNPGTDLNTTFAVYVTDKKRFI